MKSGRASSWQQAVIERIEQRTPRVKSFFLQTPLRPHVAGQHVDVRLTAQDGYQAQRAYSIASAPGDPIELAIEELAEGEVSPHLHEVAQVGDAFEVRGPLGGHFVWSATDGGPLLLVGGGSGVAPLISMVRERHRSARDVPALLVYSSRTWEDVIFRDELVRAHDAHDGFDLVLATTRGPRGRASDHERRIDAALLASILAGWGHVPATTYVCGADAFVETMSRALVAGGLSPRTIRTERYGGPAPDRVDKAGAV
jgi:ferredoxin-NADP reductase